MDALALLCTLHADGPLTLGRLREAGCGNLGAVEALGAEELGRILGAPPAAARRFAREARQLAQRMDTGQLPGPGSGASVSETFRARPGAGVGEGSQLSPAEGPRPGRRPGSERDLLARVLDSWRRAEPAGSAGAGAAHGAGPEERARSQGTAGSEGRSPSTIPARLAPRAIDGLDPAACEALAAAGVRDLAGLASAEPLALAKISGLAYTRLSRLCFLARRALGAASSAQVHGRAGTDHPDPSAPARAPQPGPPRRAAQSPESVGGPFA